MNPISWAKDLLIPLSAVDIAAVILMLLCAIRGLRRGLSGELASALSLLSAFVLAMYFWRPLLSWIEENTLLEQGSAKAAAFVATFFLGLVLILVLGALLKRIISVAIKDEADKVGGFFAGIVRSVVIVAIVFLLMNLVPSEYLNRKFGEESLIGRALIRHLHELAGSDEAGRHDAH